jgi:hypothetical protein
MPDPHGTLKPLHVVLAKHVTHQSLAFAQAEPATHTGNNTRGVLPSVLQHRQGIVYVLGNIRLGDYSNKTTHFGFNLAA